MPTITTRHPAPLARRMLPLVFLLTQLLAGCCQAPHQPATRVQPDLPEIGEVWPRRSH